jgi:tetratricopeptide (TPR) repeat protein
VTGPGGAGKSRLVKQSLRTLSARFADGALWIALDDLTTLPQVVSRLAGELRLLPGAADDPLALVCDALQPRTLLLVFDNGEHLPDLARLCERLLQSAPALKVCITSRTRLHLSGEWLLPLQGLADDDALLLFTAAARALRPDFDGTAQRGAIGTLTQAVGGLPLALLLAANWARLLPVSDIAADLQRSLALLESDDDGEERPEHRSVRATFEQSWQVLAPRERDALAALALFVGGFSRAAAHDVAFATMPLLAALADKSLLQVDGARWSMHPLLRRFAADKLDDATRAAAAQRHAVWFNRWLEQLAPALEDGQREAQEALDLELENCRAAWQWAIAHGALPLLGASSAALRRYYELRGRAAEGVALFGSALPLCAAAAAPAAAAAEVWYALAHAQYCIYRLDDAVASARESLRFARAAHARRTMIRALNVLGLAHWQWGRLGDALRYLEQSLRHARALQHVRAETVALGNLALIEKSLGHYARALERTQQVLARQRQFGDWIGVAMRLNDLATLHQAQHDWAAARRCLDEGLAVCEQHGIAFARQSLLLNLAMVSFFDGQPDDARRIGSEVLDGARASQNRQVESTVLLLLTRLAVRRGALHEAQALLDEALDGAGAMHNLGLQLDALFCRAEMLAAAGDRVGAAGLLRYYLARPELEPGERTLAQASLAALACDAPAADAPLERLLEQARQPLAAAARAT